MRPTQGAEQRLIWIQQARAGAGGEHGVGAGAQQEHALHRGDGLVHRPGRGERAPVAALARLRAAVLGDLRERMVLGQHQPGIGLVVAQHDVEARLEPLDQVGLEQQRLGLGVGGDDLHRRRSRDTMRRSRSGRRRELGVGGDALLQAARLADVERVALGIEHAVDAGAGRHGGQRRLDGGGARGGRCRGWLRGRWGVRQLVRFAHGIRWAGVGAGCRMRAPPAMAACVAGVISGGSGSLQGRRPRAGSSGHKSCSRFDTLRGRAPSCPLPQRHRDLTGPF